MSAHWPERIDAGDIADLTLQHLQLSRDAYEARGRTDRKDSQTIECRGAPKTGGYHPKDR